jgi:general secretion pathway protein C
LSSRLTAGLATALLWAAVAGSALFWWLRAGDGGAPVAAPVAGALPQAVAVDGRAVGRLLGVPEASATVAAAAPDVTSRLALRGVVTHHGRGAALIAVDGKPARPVRVGAAVEGVDGGWTLQSVTPRAVVLVSGAQQARLEMPRLSERSSAGDAVAPARTAPLMQPPPAGAPPPVVLPAPGAAPAVQRP